VKSFASDNYASVHPKILKAIEEANNGHAVAYGADPWTEKLNEKIKDVFGRDAEAFPVFNGSGANIVGLMSLLGPFEGVLCTEVSHINVDECGAAEKTLGTKLIDIATSDGKLTPEKLRPLTLNYGNEHQVQAKVLSLTQATERGTVYSMKELEALKAFTKEKKIKTFMDGARFANAVSSLGVSPRKMVEAGGVDVLSFGGTKNGLMLGEAVVVLNPEYAQAMKFCRKQTLQLSSKMRFISAQLIAYLDGDLWLANAEHANRMAKLLEQKLSKFNEIQICESVDANILFVRVPRKIIEPLQKEFPFYVWEEETCELRWMCAFDTTEDDISRFVKKIEQALTV
jgi:threonine aldolase